MKWANRFGRLAAIVVLMALGPISGADDVPRAYLDGEGPGWVTLDAKDFADANCEPTTWVWDGGRVHCSGNPVGVVRSTKTFENFELVARWRHLKSGGNSGIFAWVGEKSLLGLKPGVLPGGGIEIQVLDHGYTDQYESQTGKKADWFTTHGDVFPVGTSKMKPFPPLSPDGSRSFPSKMTPFPPTSPDGSRSFPSKKRSRGVGEWNHYYVRAINGEIRLWVNGEEVSGGSNCEPRRGYLCLESEGSPVEFEGLRIRELP